MMFRELTQEEAMEMSRQDGIELGFEQGEASKAFEMARAMRAEGIDTETITRVSGLSKEKIQML